MSTVQPTHRMQDSLANQGSTPAVSLTSAELLGAAIRNERKRYMLTQQQLAELIGTSDRTLREIEKGSPSPSMGIVLAAMEALGLSWTIS